MNPEKKDYPNDIQTEYGVIGWVLDKNELMNHLGFLNADDFYSTAHGDIWQALQSLQREGKPMTIFTVKPLLSRPEAMDVSGGPHKYLSGAHVASMEHSRPIDAARYLLALSQKRKLILACEKVASEAMSGHQTPEHHAMQLQKAVESVTLANPVKEFQDNYEVALEIIEDLKDNRMPYSTGIPKLDEAMDGGLYPGKSYGFAARKKVGKTAIAATLSANLNQAGVKHLFIAGEMSSKEIHQRVMARMGELYPSTFRNEHGKSGKADQKLVQVARSMPPNTLYKNAPGMSFDDLRRFANIAVERYGIKGFILDYWQLVQGKRKGQSTAEHQDEVAQWIADFGRRHGIWTITMAQLNQDDNTRGGEGIRLAFDQLYQLHREDLSQMDAWLEMMETRYTKWTNIGDKMKPGLIMKEKGPYFEQA